MNVNMPNRIPRPGSRSRVVAAISAARIKTAAGSARAPRGSDIGLRDVLVAPLIPAIEGVRFFGVEIPGFQLVAVEDHFVAFFSFHRLLVSGCDLGLAFVYSKPRRRIGIK